MPDLRLVQHGGFPLEVVTLDFLQTSGGLIDETQALATAAMVALGTDARAGETDVLPNPDDTDRRGWWGDMDAADIWDGWPVGTRLWLLRRAKITGPGSREGATVAVAEAYIRECLQPFVDRRIASRLVVSCERTGRDAIAALAILYRGPTPAVELHFSDLWAELGLGP